MADNLTQTEKGRALLKQAIYASATFMFIAGAICWFSPQTIENFIGLDAETTRYMAMGLLAVGFGDLIAVHFIFNKK